VRHAFAVAFGATLGIAAALAIVLVVGTRPITPWDLPI
jgi:hypothetical protein